MRLRIIILILALFAFLSATAGGLLYYYSYRNAAFQKTEADAYSRLNLLTDQLSYYLSEHIKPVKTLAGIKELAIVLADTNLESIYKANQILDNFTKSLDLEVSYLMDKNGITLCSSNRNAKDSFVGNDFAFRPYYKKAIKGMPATYLALGTTSRKRGVYYSHPIYDETSHNVLGVAVIKASVEFVETKLFPKSDDILLFVDPDGVIFISNKDNLKFNFLWKPDEKKIQTIENSRQFGIGPWAWTGFSKDKTGYVTDKNNVQYLFSSLAVENYPDWEIINLRNYKEITKQVSKPFVRVIGPATTSVLILTGILVLILYLLGIQEITKRKKAEKKLRLSEERYRHIYHKTPVMLHSIDIKGQIIRVSDHWVEVMGYKRENVIGKPLISFFTPESKKYAINVIFPIFFKTGFCKDIPYTYVKKNGEKMDTLLSCYGVRDENGNVVRSLAVSMDVTEKNHAQKDLQIATEKLSQYSQDLEQQVKKRTIQLEKAQDNLKNLSKNIIASQEREKALVARELHDHLGQVLTALRIDAVWVEKFLMNFDEKAGNRAGKMCSLIDDTINDVRDMAYRLRPRVLDDLGLVDALESLLSDFEKRSNVSCVFKHGEIPKIKNTLSTALYRIGQEAVTNSLRYSKATTIIVELKTEDDEIVLLIQDNGCGFDVLNNNGVNGFGLEGMRERANLVGGKLYISSRLSQGTSVCCKVKIKG
ncbi:MAG: PAS domain S-box protein [Deltaproteobacteria bacterium]|uniref:sensor histidine kinase n=1 Tax=Desulfobacula sp. TaxID=2593537 RepID=UPI0019CAE37F|nr:PAS domain S-box protein [Candidatus Desulfobacula maris]MBL6994016.1 PAS domain S-box protein [Desulfobacula sp.]